MRDVLPTLQRWIHDGQRAAMATVVTVDRSAPREPGSVMAVSETGEVVGSVTGGCVEPAVYQQAEEVLHGAPARMATYGYADDEAFEVGLPCGGNVGIFVEPMVPALVEQVAAAVRDERPVAYLTTIGGAVTGNPRVVGADADPADELEAAARPLLELGESGVVTVGGDEVFVSSFVPRPAMYVFGAIDFASALCTVGKFLGYRVTVCDPRAIFVTPERFPDADELVSEWPHEFLATAPVDARTAVCVLTHDAKFDVPALKAALATPARYIGAMGSRRTTERRREKLLEEGVDEDQLSRIHAPIGLPIASRTPEEVAIAIGAEIVSVANRAPRKEDVAARTRVSRSRRRRSGRSSCCSTPSGSCPACPARSCSRSSTSDTWKSELAIKLGPVGMQFLADVKLLDRDDDAKTVRLGVSARDTRGKGGAEATVDSALQPDRRRRHEGRDDHRPAVLRPGRPARPARGGQGRLEQARRPVRRVHQGPAVGRARGAGRRGGGGAEARSRACRSRSPRWWGRSNDCSASAERRGRPREAHHRHRQRRPARGGRRGAGAARLLPARGSRPHRHAPSAATPCPAAPAPSTSTASP